MNPLKLQVLQDQFSIHRLAAGSNVPDQVYESGFLTISKTADELSIVCDASLQLNSEKCESGWSCFKVIGPLDFSLTGILASLAADLATAGISIFAISTYDTDYILVKTEQLPRATEALRASGHTVVEKQ